MDRSTSAGGVPFGEAGMMEAPTMKAAQPDQAEFRAVMGLLPTGVSVVTTRGPDGPSGMTANAVASLSLEPVLMMVGFDLKSRTLVAVRSAGRFAVNFLSAHQEEESRRFASKLPEVKKFAGLPHEPVLGVPVLRHAAGWIVCDLEALYPGGDHLIGVGRVLALHRNPREPEPLVFHRGRYRKLDGD